MLKNIHIQKLMNYFMYVTRITAKINAIRKLIATD